MHEGAKKAVEQDRKTSDEKIQEIKEESGAEVEKAKKDEKAAEDKKCEAECKKKEKPAPTPAATPEPTEAMSDPFVPVSLLEIDEEGLDHAETGPSPKSVRLSEGTQVSPSATAKG